MESDRGKIPAGGVSERAGGPSVRLIASKKTWIDGQAVEQLRAAATLPGMRLAVGLPDLHPGMGCPVGAAFLSEGVFYPHLAGNDIGCGVGLWRTDLERRKAKLDRWAAKLQGLESPWDGNLEAWLAEHGLPRSAFDAALGTIGGGNHFAELQQVESVEDPAAFDALGLAENRLFLVVHSGSRGLGEAILREHAERFRGAGLPEGSEAAIAYRTRHEEAVAWARTNRMLIAARFLSMLSGEGERVLDVCHNSITARAHDGRPHWLHRKGAAPADEGPIVIPGSRGAFTYLVAPQGDLTSCAWSLAHGAGRRWGRRDAKSRLIERYPPASLARTELGSRVICEDRDLLYEEAPQAYKDIDAVVRDLLEAGLVRVVACFRPLITYKVRASGR